MASWVAPHLTGGLGNRLFELAAALGAAEKWSVPCVFYKKYIVKNDHQGGGRDSIIDLFPEIPMIDDDAKQPYSIIKEPNGNCFIYTPLPDTPPSERTVIHGYRQTILYGPTNPILPSWKNVLSAGYMETLQYKYGLNTPNQQANTWFLHVRLGDYKVLPHHQIPILSYYRECLDKIPRGTRLLLFSDEPELCSGWLGLETRERGINLTVCEETNDVASLWLMSQCHGGAIVANSTFSWWGAYFAKYSAQSSESKQLEFAESVSAADSELLGSNHIAVPQCGSASNKNTNYVAFYPSVWGSGLPPARDIVPSWGTVVPIFL